MRLRAKLRKKQRQRKGGMQREFAVRSRQGNSRSERGGAYAGPAPGSSFLWVYAHKLANRSAIGHSSLAQRQLMRRAAWPIVHMMRRHDYRYALRDASIYAFQQYGAGVRIYS